MNCKVGWLIILTLMLGGQAGAGAGDDCWNGTITQRDGVAYVHNAARSNCPPRIYDMVPRWSLTSDETDGFIFGAIVDAVMHPTGVLCLLDNTLKCIHLIGRTGDHLGTVGREGEGPGEFQFPTDLFLVDELAIGVVDAVRNAATIMTLDNAYLWEWRPELQDRNRVDLLQVNVLDEDAFVACLELHDWDSAGATDEVLVGIFRRDGTLVAELGRKTLERPNPSIMIYDEELSDPTMLLGIGLHDEVFVACGHVEYEYACYASNGERLLVISQDYHPWIRDSQQKATLAAFWEALYQGYDRTVVRISDYERSVLAVHSVGDSVLWIETSRGWYERQEGVALRYDCAAPDGRLLHEVQVAGHLDPNADSAFRLDQGLVVISEGASLTLSAVGVSSSDSGSVVSRPAITLYELQGRDDLSGR